MCLSQDPAASSYPLLTETHPNLVQLFIPNIVCWPADASELFFAAVNDQYFASCSIDGARLRLLIQQAPSPRAAIQALDSEGVFSTHAGRQALVDIADNGGAADEKLSTVDRYARYAFVLDGTTVTCGALPAA